MPDSAPNPKLRVKLNLLHPKEFQNRLPERFLKWLISYGRFIVIFVEIIVVAAFLARFKYDADLDKLKRDIDRDLNYVEQLTTEEALITQAQNRLTQIDKIYQSYDRWQETIATLSKLIPISIQFISLSIEEAGEKDVTFRLNAVTVSNADLGIFLNNLKTNNKFREITLTNIAFEENQITFTITGTKLYEP